MIASPPSTLLDKIWNNHLVHSDPGAPDLLYVDLHLLHEVTSAQAFEGLKVAGRTVRRPDLCVATVDHNIPTTDRSLPVLDSIARVQMEVLRENAQSHGIRLFDVDDERQGIVHVIGPELGLTRPGMVIVCGDSHTSTHGAFGALSFGIGTSEVEHVLATQCIPQRRPKAMEIRLEGDRPVGISAKDLILAIIGEVGVAGAAGHVIEYTGPVVGSLSMEERMTICNMSIEAGARAGMISPDTTTFEYLRDREFGPKSNDFDDLKTEWETLETDDGATFDRSVVMDIGDLEPQVTWGTNPGMVTGISGGIPNPDEIEDEEVRDSAERALKYMGLEPGTPMESINIDRVFVGSCTNGRLEDLREVARIVNGKRVHSSVHAMVVPGSTAVRRQAELEGLDRVFKDAGFEWREAGCSMCIGMNPDTLSAGERCASTTNRNFEGRQGRGGRTHLVSPATAAATALAGRFTDPRSG
ncbi:MAG: 3-isopropylmalate dehydratase large subunit [Gammaproteobacteria bacterium]|nr:MAG: 3-isopropylmalate dehydratase large subunit [Gammaproteobacteria bacterium]